MATPSRVGTKGWRAAIAFARLVMWLFRRFLLIIAPLYPVLKWIVSVVLLALMINLFSVYIAEGFQCGFLTVAAEFMAVHRVPIFLAIEGLLVLFLLSRIGYTWRETQRRLRVAFSIHVPAHELSLADLGFCESRRQESERCGTHGEDRPFFGTYFPRKAIEDIESMDTDAEMLREYAEEDLAQRLKDGRGFLLLGAPYSGKTMTLLQTLQTMTGYTVVSPDDSRPVPDEETFALLSGRKVVILLDNLPTLAHSDYNLPLFVKRITEVTGHRCRVAGTCRDGGDLTAISAGHGNHVAYFCESLEKLHLHPLSNTQRVELAATAGMVLDPQDARNYPLPGNITMRDRIRAMKERFRTLPELGKDALRAMKLLDTGGIPLTVPRIQVVLLHVFHRSLEEELMENTLESLWDEFFLLEQPSKGRIHPHFGHLVYSVSYWEGEHPEDERWDNLAQALERHRDIEGLLHLSHGHRLLGDLIRSLEALEGLLRIDPEHAEAHFRRGYNLARLDRLEEAREANMRALMLRPEFAEAHNNRGYILARLGDFSGALIAVERALELRPDFEDAHTNRAIVLARLGRYGEALGEFSTALGIRPENYYAYLNLGITLSHKNAFNEALTAFEQALQFRPNYPEAHLNRGITLARMGRFKEALQEQDQSIQLAPDYAKAHMHRGQTLASLRRYEDAVEALSKAIELQPDYAVAFVNRARTFAHMGPEKREAASRDWQTALDLGLVFPQRHLLLGVSLGRAGELAKAKIILDRLIDSYKDYPEAHQSRGITLARMGRFEEALADFTRALELRPDYAEAHCERGSTLANLGRPQEALDAVDIALGYRPKFPAAYFARGFVLSTIKGFDRDRLKQALEAFEEAILLRPEYPEAHRECGFILGQLGRDEEALAAYNRAIELRPEFPEALFGKARTLCFLARGSSESFPPNESFREAMDLLERAVSIDKSIVGRIRRDRNAFRQLWRSREYGPRFAALVWVEGR